MEIVEIPCRADNYGGLRWQEVEYLVVHYTAGFNDTARNNGLYFARAVTGASAHYFVDGETVVRSVPEDRVAWHCGGSHYFHPHCRNGNSIGVEICTRYEDGVYSLAPAAVEQAKELIRQLMQQYRIPPEHVVRHYDVTHKLCPAPFVGAGQPLWEEFKEDLMRYQKVEQLPGWSQATVEKLLKQKLLRGDGEDLDLSRDMLRLLVMLDRAGAFPAHTEEQEEQG